MPEEPDPLSEGERALVPITLGYWQRTASGALGALFVGFAGTALILGHDGVAASAFVLAGLALLLLAVLGILPIRLRVGNVAVDLHEGKILDQAIANVVTPDQVKEISQAVEDSTSPEVHRRVQQLTEAAVFEREVVDACERAARALDLGTFLDGGNVTMTQGYDAKYYSRKAQKTVVIEVKLRLDRRESIVVTVERLVENTDPGENLLIVADQLTMSTTIGWTITDIAGKAGRVIMLTQFYPQAITQQLAYLANVVSEPPSPPHQYIFGPQSS